MPDEAHQFSLLAEELIGDFRRIPGATSAAAAHRRPAKDMGALMQDLRVKYKIGIESEEAVIQAHWEKIVGPNARYSHPASIDKRGWLVVLTSNAVVRSELFMHRARILAKIQKLPGCGRVRALTIRAG